MVIIEKNVCNTCFGCEIVQVIDYLVGDKVTHSILYWGAKGVGFQNKILLPRINNLHKIMNDGFRFLKLSQPSLTRTEVGFTQK